MVSTALILLTGRYGPIVAIPSGVILAREISISALREWMAERGKRNVVQVGFAGKLKTALTMISLAGLLCLPHGEFMTSSFFFFLFKNISFILLYLSTILTCTSGSVYFKASLPFLFEK